jgi:hypothetical protein
VALDEDHARTDSGGRRRVVEQLGPPARTKKAASMSFVAYDHGRLLIQEEVGVGEPRDDVALGVAGLQPGEAVWRD